MFVQFETLAKNQNFYQKVETQYEKPVNIKSTTRCDLPMGTKRGSFMSRSPPVKQQKKTVRSSAITKWNQFEPLHHLKFEKEDVIIDQVQQFRKSPPSSSHDYSKAKCTS